VTKNKGRSIPYLEHLKTEIRMKHALLGGSRVVEQLHLGGGTPTFLSDDQLTDLMEFLGNLFTFSTADSADYSIEIDPRELRPNTLKRLRELGFNRLSYGVQDLDERVQAAVNRVQPESMIRAVMLEARELGFRSINIDLIYGLPHQSVTSFDKTLDAIIDMRPDRLSIFNYAHLPQRFMPQRRISEDDLPSAQEKLQIFGHAISKLDDAGYHYVGMDHFALPDDELAIAQRDGKLHRNFQGYTTHGDCDLIGFGVSSISQIGDLYSQNAVSLEDWQEALENGGLPLSKACKTNADDRLRRDIIMGLLCHLDIRFNELDQQHNIDSRTYLRQDLARLQPMRDDGLVTIDEHGVQITDSGRLLVRHACMAFDPYRQQDDQTRFSKAI
jgi:oxygen-independent coproporphyrinogen-3 oxidase